MNIKPQQLEKMQSAQGFITVLDQSGGSTPKALENYGIAGDAWSSAAGLVPIIEPEWDGLNVHQSDSEFDSMLTLR